jgi:hypothetical protein
MRDVCSLIWLALIGLFRSQASLQAEILTLRHQLNVLRRKSPQRLTFSSIDSAGIVPASERIGAGNQDRAVDVQRPRWKSVSLFAR